MTSELVVLIVSLFLSCIKAAIDAGDITIVAEAYTDDWQPANAQKNMEQILTEADNGVDAVVASNDGTAGGVVAAGDLALLPTFAAAADALGPRPGLWGSCDL